MTPAPRLWHGTTPDSDRRLHLGWPEEMTFSADACFAWTFSGSVSGIEIDRVVVVIAMLGDSVPVERRTARAAEIRSGLDA